MTKYGNISVTFVTSLRECQKSFKPKNQLVLLYEEKQHRQKWLGRKTVDLILSEDEQVRGARVLLRKSRNTVD